MLRRVRARQAAERLGWGPAYADADLVFAQEDGTPVHPNVVSRTFLRLVRETKMPPIRFHALRHTSASVGLRSGETMKEVSERLGHSTTRVTADIYAHVYPTVAAESAARRGAALPSEVKTFWKTDQAEAREQGLAGGEPPPDLDLRGAASENRTRDLLITSETLCRLS